MGVVRSIHRSQKSTFAAFAAFAAYAARTIPATIQHPPILPAGMLIAR
jgi:hypothetical protein